MKQWTTDTGEGSKFFDNTAIGLVERAKVFTRANDQPDVGIGAAFEQVTALGEDMEITEDYLMPNDNTTGAPHLAGASGKGQRYRYFKNGPQTLDEWYTFGCGAHANKELLVYRGPDAHGGEERYTFGETLELSRSLAAYMFNELGVRKGDRIAQLSRNHPEWVFSLMAATSSGCIAVPSNSLWVGSEIEYAMNDSGTSIAFVDGPRAAQVLPLCREGKLPKLKAVIVSRDADNVAAQGGGSVRVLALEDVLAACRSLEKLNMHVSPEDSALIMYTSGTTGHPKGVVLTNRSIVTAIRMVLFYPICMVTSLKPSGGQAAKSRSSSQDVILCPVPLFHATGLHAIFLLSFALGRKVVLMHKWDVLDAFKLIESEKVTGFIGVPTMSMELLEHPDHSKYDLSSLKSIGGGGAPPPKKLSAVTAKKGRGAGQGWGMTETNAFGVTTASSKEYVANPTSCGRPFVLVDMKIIDDSNREVAPGEVGEVLIRGVTMMKEYWNKPEATAEAMSVDGWLRTGDVGKLDADGSLYILDRAKDLIIRGGENISCAEVETVFYEHPSIQECAVFSMPNERLGEIVACAVVRRSGASAFSGNDLSSFAIERLAKFKVPEEIYLWDDQLPRGATGKIPKREIRKLIQEGNAPCIRIFPPQSKM